MAAHEATNPMPDGSLVNRLFATGEPRRISDCRIATLLELVP